MNKPTSSRVFLLQYKAKQRSLTLGDMTQLNLHDRLLVRTAVYPGHRICQLFCFMLAVLIKLQDLKVYDMVSCICFTATFKQIKNMQPQHREKFLQLQTVSIGGETKRQQSPSAAINLKNVFASKKKYYFENSSFETQL